MTLANIYLPLSLCPQPDRSRAGGIMNWRAMVSFKASGWAHNALVFATRAEALKSAKDMFHHEGAYRRIFPDEVYVAYAVRETKEAANYAYDLVKGICAPLPVGFSYGVARYFNVVKGT